jgi:ribosomal protein S18 acetylase RimI-like enzyme
VDLRLLRTEPELTIDAADPLPLAAELREVHRSALGAGALSDEWAATRLPAHTTRDDFVFLIAREGDEVGQSEIVGFAYGYTGSSGHWWTDHVEESLTGAQRAEWIEPPHFEIVELHVRPSQQRRGIGSALLAQLVTRQPHDRALLSTQTGSRKARGFYAKNGWGELASVDFGPGYPPYIVLGKRLFAGA